MDEVADGGYDGVRTVGGHVVGAVGDDDEAGLGGEAGEAGLDVVDPDAGVFGVGLATGGEYGEGFVSEGAGLADLLGAFAHVFEFARAGADGLLLEDEAGSGDALTVEQEAADAHADEDGRPAGLALVAGGEGVGVGLPGGREEVVLVFLRGVDEDHGGDLGWEEAVEDADIVATEGVADQEKGRVFAGGAEEGFEFEGDLEAGAGEGAFVACAIAGTVVAADAGEFGDLRLDGGPGFEGVAEAGGEDDGGGALALAVDLMVGDEAAGFGEAVGVEGAADGLVEGSGEGGGEEEGGEGEGGSPEGHEVSLIVSDS